MLDTRNLHAILTDYGTSEVLGNQTLQIMSTVHFSPPESRSQYQAAPNPPGSYDYRVPIFGHGNRNRRLRQAIECFANFDIYSLGVLLIMLLNPKPSKVHPSYLQSLEYAGDQIPYNETHNKLTSVLPHTPEDFLDIVQSMVHMNRDARMSATDVLNLPLFKHELDRQHLPRWMRYQTRQDALVQAATVAKDTAHTTAMAHLTQERNRAEARSTAKDITIDTLRQEKTQFQADELANTTRLATLAADLAAAMLSDQQKQTVIDRMQEELNEKTEEMTATQFSLDSVETLARSDGDIRVLLQQDLKAAEKQIQDLTASADQVKVELTKIRTDLEAKEVEAQTEHSGKQALETELLQLRDELKQLRARPSAPMTTPTKRKNTPMSGISDLVANLELTSPAKKAHDSPSSSSSLSDVKAPVASCSFSFYRSGACAFPLEPIPESGTQPEIRTDIPPIPEKAKEYCDRHKNVAKTDLALCHEIACWKIEHYFEEPLPTKPTHLVNFQNKLNETHRASNKNLAWTDLEVLEYGIISDLKPDAQVATGKIMMPGSRRGAQSFEKKHQTFYKRYSSE